MDRRLVEWSKKLQAREFCGGSIELGLDKLVECNDEVFVGCQVESY